MNGLFKILLLLGCPVIVSNLGHGILKGKVKSMTYTSYRVSRDSMGHMNKSIERADYTNYTAIGNIAIQCTGVWSGTRWSQTISHYNGAGLLMEQITYQHNESDNIRLQDEPTNILWQNKSIYTYDKIGLLMEKKYYQRFFADDSVLTQYTIYIYDSLGNTTKFDSIKTGGTKIVKTVNHKHDSVILIPASISRMPDDTFNKPVSSFKYYKNGAKKECMTIQSNGNKYISKYDKKGSLIEYGSYSSDGKVFEKSLIGLDKHHNGFNKTYTAKGLTDVQISKYTYDRIGNMIIDSTFDNDTLTYIRTQVFEYY